jgi:hypothetical protein
MIKRESKIKKEMESYEKEGDDPIWWWYILEKVALFFFFYIIEFHSFSLSCKNLHFAPLINT